MDMKTTHAERGCKMSSASHMNVDRMVVGQVILWNCHVRRYSMLVLGLGLDCSCQCRLIGVLTNVRSSATSVVDVTSPS
jgi:hypothetical protein